MPLHQLLQTLEPTAPVLQATFGLEREGFRVNKNGNIAQSCHPEVLGSRNFHPYIQTDYSEAQLELITPICSSTKEALRSLGAITEVAQRSIAKDEAIWPLSMPPHLTEDDIQIAALDDDFEYHYRVQLAETYGKIVQSISGIHYNIELGSDFLQALFDNSSYANIKDFKNDLYIKLAQNFLRYRWFLTYLYGAAPIAEAGFLSSPLTAPVRSLRNSHLGYVNKEDVHVSFSNLEQYVTDIERHIKAGKLSAEKEFYSAVRLRGSKRNRDYLEQGITYLELRCFDLNPFHHLGIDQETLDTVHLFLLALLWLDSPENVDKTLQTASQLNDQIALSHPLDVLPESAPVDDIIRAMNALIQHFHLLQPYQDCLAHIKEKVADPSLTLAGRLLDKLDGLSLENFGLEQAQAFHQYAWTAPYALKGYENMELSTQMLMFDIIQKGVHLEILDEEDQFLKLSHQGHVEYVKNGNMTSKDNHVIPLAMANKTVTKKILDAQGFATPKGAEFSNKETAYSYYYQIKGKAIVVKPKSTNFGLGISIFQEKASQEDYQKAVDIAFSEDSAILVEEFIAGTEYRFFILDGKCEAVLLRLPAHVVGDGQHTIRELVALKNDNPLRGRDHRSPLEIIQLGDIELLMIQQQGYGPDDILEKDVRVDLRGNSNISTGGDSVDVTEDMHTSYKELAADMAVAMGAWACGVDLIIPDTSQVASKENPHSTCIELNFNPSMYMHTYCAKGPGQAITPKILAKLFPEI